MGTRMCWIWLLLASVSSAAELSPQHRVANVAPGVCFWACLESVGRQQAVASTYGLRDEVVSTGIGRDLGARPFEIRYWSMRRGFSILKIKPQPLDGLRYRTDGGQLVIATCRNWFGARDPNHDGSHAVVVLSVSEHPFTYVDGNGRQFHDFWVTYYDPNVGDMLLPWHTFADRYVEGHVVEPQTLSPTQLTVPIADGGTDAHLSSLRPLLPSTAVSLPLRRNLETGSPTLGLGLDVSAASGASPFLGGQR